MNVPAKNAVQLVTNALNDAPDSRRLKLKLAVYHLAQGNSAATPIYEAARATFHPR